jgi:hypothetical protein
MKYLTIILLLFCTGCGSFSIFGGKGETNIPSKPQRGFYEVEDIRSNVDIIVDISHEAYTTGVNAHSYESETLLKSAKVLQTIAGLPTEKIDWRIKREVEILHGRILENERQYRLDKVDWEQQIAALSDEKQLLKNQNSRLSSALESFKFWFWISVIALGVLTFLCPTIGIPLIKFLVGRAKKAGEVAIVETASAIKGQFGQVVEAIEKYKEEDPENAKKLLTHLERKTDSQTRKIINEIKHK